MRDYELVLIISPEVADDAVDGIIGRVSNTIANGGGEVTDVDNWGRRRIAFPINHFRHGTYTVLTAKMNPTATGDLERSLSLSEDVLRHLLVKLEKAPVKPQVPQPVAVAPQADAPEEKEQSNDGGNTE